MTIAFSLKSNMWTSEYSFEPTCYASTDNRMISFKDVNETAPARTWLHDETQDRNNFYLTPYSSKLSVVSNENPSATKAFEAVSLETSYPGWRMDVATQEQEGETRDFSEKENDQYAAVPKDAKVSAANLTYVGTASGDQLTSESLQEGRIVLTTMSGRFAPGILCYRNKAQGTEFVQPGAQEGRIAAVHTSGARHGAIGLDEDFMMRNYVLCRDFITQSKTLSFNAPDLIFDPSFSEPEGSDFYSARNQVEIWIASPGYGESMKGDYMVVNLQTEKGPENFELYAINVDQHQVNLDHSLGQNN